MDNEDVGKPVIDYFGISGNAPKVLAYTGNDDEKKFVLDGEVIVDNIKERPSMHMESCVPPGFRFHPTEELVGYYLKRKINSLKINLDVIVEIDLYKIEPWDIQETLGDYSYKFMCLKKADRCKLGYEEQNEWSFFSHKDKKYPTETRTNKATVAGLCKAIARD